MKVRLVWTETTECSAEVELDAGAYVEWINESTPPTDPPVTITDTTERDLKEWYQSGRDPEWQVVADATRGAQVFTDTEEIAIERVEFIEGEDYSHL